jgi:DNA polymerase III subunit beta
MKFSCLRKTFSHALEAVTRIIDTNVTLPVLNNILMKAEGSNIHFSSTNLEMAINYWIKADVINEGAATVPAKLLSGYIELLTDEDLHFEMKEGLALSIDSQTSKTKMKCIDAEEFPTITNLTEQARVTLPTKDLPEAISQVIFAAASSSTRPILAGVYVETSDNQVKMVATDSYRLSEKIITLETKAPTASCIIPTRAMSELARLCALENSAEELIMVIGANQVMFQLGEIQFYSRLVEGKFPNYQPIIPTERKSVTTVDTSDFARLVKRVNLFARENDNKVLLEFHQNSLQVTTPATQIGEEEGTLPISLTGEENKIALNSEFILHILNNIGSDQTEITINDKATPALFKSLEDDGFLHLIMPLKMD